MSKHLKNRKEWSCRKTSCHLVWLSCQVTKLFERLQNPKYRRNHTWLCPITRAETGRFCSFVLTFPIVTLIKSYFSTHWVSFRFFARCLSGGGFLRVILKTEKVALRTGKYYRNWLSVLLLGSLNDTMNGTIQPPRVQPSFIPEMPSRSGW